MPPARELALEAKNIFPLIDEPTPAMVETFAKKLGWEARNSPHPSVNLWTTLTVAEDQTFHVFAIGGVMRMRVSSRGKGDAKIEYLVPGSWIGSVVVERIR